MRLAPRWVGVVLSLAWASVGFTQQPPYPRVNVARTYQVDPTWPKKPAEYTWEAVPGIAVDEQDNVWVFTRSKPPIQVYAPDGKLLRAWGDNTIETAHHLKIDRDGNIWVADIGLHIIRKFNPQGEVLRTIGVPGEAGLSKTHLDKPTDMAVAPNGHVFVSDGYGNNRVVHFDAKGKYVNSWGQLGTGPTDFSLPHAIAMDNRGRLFVADRNNVRVSVYEQSGKLLDTWQHLIVPWGFWLTPKNHLWVCGSSPMGWRRHPDYPEAPLGCPPDDQILMKFDTRGKALQLVSLPKGADGKEQPGDVNWIHAIAEDSQGNLYVGDILGKRAQKFVPVRAQAASEAKAREARVQQALPTVESVAQAAGGEATYLEVDGHAAFLIRSRHPTSSRPMPWVWYAPTLRGQPRPAHVWMFRQFLEQGIAIAGVDVGESMGNAEGRATYAFFHKLLTKQHGLAPRAVLLPQSRGGLMLYNWAAEHPEQVAAVAGIYTVCDMSSWPGLERASSAYATSASGLAAVLLQHNPIDRLAPLAAARVPILHIHGDSDRAVPIQRNAGQLVKRYRALGGEAELIVIAGKGHEEAEAFFQSQPFVDFVIKRALHR